LVNHILERKIEMNTKKVLYNLIVVLAMITLAACSAIQYAVPNGQVYTATVNTTINGLASCLRQEAGTGIIEDGSKVVFIFRAGEGWGFAGFNVDGRILANSMEKANITNYTDGDLMIQDWIKQGWTLIDPRQLPPEVLDSIAFNVGAFAASMPTFLMLPIGTINPAQYGAIGNPVNE
jgi:hypothetical protein